MSLLEDAEKSALSGADKTPPGPHALAPLGPFLLAGAVLGALERAFFGGAKFPLVSGLMAAAFGAILALPLGLALWAGAAPVRLLLRKRRAATRPPADGPDERAAVLRAHAYAIAALLLLPLLSVASRYGLNTLFDLQEEALARDLSLVFVIGVLGGALVGAPVLARGLLRLLLAIDRRRKLPVPLPGWALWAVFVTAPLFLALYPFVKQNGAMLGVVRDAMGAVFAVGLGVQAWLLLEGMSARAARWLSIVTLAAVMIGAGLTGFYSASMPKTLAAALKSPTAELGAKLARFVTDVDRDGISSLFGGTDCAPFDGMRAPTKVEIPGNGVDEDCDGSDAPPAKELHRPDLFSNGVDRDLVRPLHVVWVILETVRADHVSAISYDRPTTPFLNELAQESLLFTRAYSQSSATVFSIPSMMSGIEPSAAEWKRDRGHPQFTDLAPLLSERLKKKGYRTGFVVSHYLQEAFVGLQRGYDEVLLAESNAELAKDRNRRNPFATAKAAELLASADPKDRLFLTVYYPDTHAPYIRHPDVDSSSFDQGEIGDYDTDIAWADQQIRALVEALKSRPALWDDTILVINADHGEEFGEHGGSRHAQTCHEESVHVPLLVRIPGIPAKRIDTPVALVDIVPTVLEMLGDRQDVGRLGGQSLLVPALRPDRLDPARPIFCDIASVTSKYGTFLRRSVRSSQYALFQDVTEGRYSLFDTQADPGEREDLAGRGDHAEQVHRLRALLAGKATGTLTDHKKMPAAPRAAPSSSATAAPAP